MVTISKGKQTCVMVVAGILTLNCRNSHLIISAVFQHYGVHLQDQYFQKASCIMHITPVPASTTEFQLVIFNSFQVPFLSDGKKKYITSGRLHLQYHVSHYAKCSGTTRKLHRKHPPPLLLHKLCVLRRCCILQLAVSWRNCLLLSVGWQTVQLPWRYQNT